MAEIKLEDIANLLKVELEPIKTDLSEIKSTVEAHSAALFELSKDVKDLKDEMIVRNRRMDKHQEAIKYTSDKVGIT